MTRSRFVSALAVAVLGTSALPAVWAADAVQNSPVATPATTVQPTATAAPTPTPSPAPMVSGVAVASAMDARRALGETVNNLNVDNVALSRVVDFLRDVSGANIVVNWKVLDGVGVAKETPISLQVRDLSLRKMLRLVLDQASPNTVLVFNVDSNVIEVTSQDDADKKLVTKVYVVDDLVMTDNSNVTPPSMNLQAVTQNNSTSGGGTGSGGTTGSIFNANTANSGQDSTDTTEKRGQDLASLVREVVRPSIWRENGGTASIRYFSGKSIVTAPQSVQEAIGGPMAPEGGQRFGM